MTTHDQALDITRMLTSGWVRTATLNDIVFGQYYHGQHNTDVLTEGQRQNRDFYNLWRPVNICRVVIDEPAGYITKSPIQIMCKDDKLASWGQSFFKKRISPQLKKIVQYQGIWGEGFVRLWTDYEGDEKGLKVLAIPTVEGMARRVEPDYGLEDPDELSACVIYYRQPQTASKKVLERKLVMTRKKLVEFEREATKPSTNTGGNETTTSSESWREVANVDNIWETIPVAMVRNDGPSDLYDLVNLQDDYNLGWFDFRHTRRFHGFPILTSEHDLGGNTQVGPGRMLIGANIKRIEAGDLSQILEGQDAILMNAAIISRSVALAENMRTARLSGDAMERLMQGLITKCEEKSMCIAAGVAQLLSKAARMLARDPALYAVDQPVDAEGNPVPAELLNDAKFEVVITPKMPADANRRRDSVTGAVSGGLYSQRQGLIEEGKTEEEADRIVSEKQRESAMNETGLEDKKKGSINTGKPAKQS